MNNTKAISTIENESYFITFRQTPDEKIKITILTPQVLCDYLESNSMIQAKEVLGKIFRTIVR